MHKTVKKNTLLIINSSKMDWSENYCGCVL